MTANPRLVRPILSLDRRRLWRQNDRNLLSMPRGLARDRMMGSFQGGEKSKAYVIRLILPVDNEGSSPFDHLFQFEIGWH